MDIKTKLAEDLKAAMRNKDRLRKDVIQICRSAILQIEKDEHRQLGDDEVAGLLIKEHKKRSETIAELNGQRPDLEEQYRAEMEVIEAYLPKQLTESEVEDLVKAAIAEVGASSARDMGQVMKVIMPQVKGKADGKLVNSIVKRLLA